MALPNGYAVAKFIHKLGSDPEDMIITVGLEMGTVPTTPQVEAIWDAYNDNMVPWLNDEYDFRGVELVGRDSGGADWMGANYSVSTGGSAGASLPQNCAILLRKLTGVPGRANRGRCYLPGYAQEAEIAANGQLDLTFLASLQTAATAFFDDLNVPLTTGIGSVRIIHPTGTPTEVTAFLVDDVIATQRRRLR